MNTAPVKINLCCGSVRLPGWVNVDYACGDLRLDLGKELLPFPDQSADALACISAINYFSRERALEIVRDVRRVMKPGGVVRFGVQDLRVLARKYLERDEAFYFQKLPDGRDRFPGKTFADKLNEFFYGFSAGPDLHCRHVYDFESLAALFEEAGFDRVEEKGFCESAIEEVRLLDNRPEQMFFLEASWGAESDDGRSEAVEALRSEAEALLAAGRKEEGWQRLLKLLDLAPADRAGAVRAMELSLEAGLPEDALKALYEWKRHSKGDDALDRLLVKTQGMVEAGRQERARTAVPTQALDALDARRNAVLADEAHLAECMNWLRTAQGATADGGCSAVYHMRDRRWDVSYPETTGYIISTALAYADLTGDASWIETAKTMSDWERRIQAPDGGAGEPFGYFIKRPRVFNTGQLLLGWVALARRTGDQGLIDAAVRAGEWIVASQDPDGKWVTNTYSGQPKTYKTRVAWALLELAELTGEPAFRRSAERFLHWSLGRAQRNGWFADASLTDPDKPWTHLIGYVLVGLLECCRFDCDFDKAKAVELMRAAARNLCATQRRGMGGRPGLVAFPGTFDPQWRSRDAWTCVTGDAQLEFFLRRLVRFVPDEIFVRVADGLLDELKSIHFVDGVTDPALRGGLPGSHPVGQSYCPYSVPNWGVKFFADSLLQRLLPNIDALCLG